MGIDEAKRCVKALVGRPLRISVNRGRRRVERYSGEIESVFPSVVVLRINGEKRAERLTASYSDLICGDVRIRVIKQ